MKIFYFLNFTFTISIVKHKDINIQTIIRVSQHTCMYLSYSESQFGQREPIMSTDNLIMLMLIRLYNLYTIVESSSSVNDPWRFYLDLRIIVEDRENLKNSLYAKSALKKLES